jgi:hypothetical protein
MKTNPFARGILKIRVILFCLAVVGMAGVGFNLGESLTLRLGQTTAPQTGGPQAPSVSLAEALAATCFVMQV